MRKWGLDSYYHLAFICLLRRHVQEVFCVLQCKCQLSSNFGEGVGWLWTLCEISQYCSIKTRWRSSTTLCASFAEEYLQWQISTGLSTFGSKMFLQPKQPHSKIVIHPCWKKPVMGKLNVNKDGTSHSSLKLLNPH